VSFQRANNYRFEDDEGELRGRIRFIADGKARGELALERLVGNELEVESSELGLIVSGLVHVVPDGDSIFVAVVLPRLNVNPRLRAEPFDGVGVIVTKRGSIGGINLVHGPLETYAVRRVRGTGDVLR
jgi:hypothetical protein